MGFLNTHKGKAEPPLALPIKIIGDDGKIYDTISQVNLSTHNRASAELILDYGRCVGGLPVFTVARAESDGPVVIEVIYSETRRGLDSEQGDGPFFLFSNAMNTYRRETIKFNSGSEPQSISSRFTQDSQRYQKLKLLTPNASITFLTVGFRPARVEAPLSCSFECSDAMLNRIYQDGARTVQMCTLEAGEVPEAWEVTAEGTRVFGQHWAPCRSGSYWSDKTVSFEVKVEELGASWGLHMVANGLIFCLDASSRVVRLYEGLSHMDTVFPSILKGEWPLPADLQLSQWLLVQSEAVGDAVTLRIESHVIGRIEGVDIKPITGGTTNTGSVAFGGPEGYVSLYRNLLVQDGGNILYENKLLLEDKERTFADFAVGTNALACTIDGAKRDRAVFAGDLYVMGRSIFYSTGNLEAVRGSLQLLTSHQTKDGYLGNLCPAQAPLHVGNEEPSGDSFYSLSYSLLLIVAAKDYWMHSGDDSLIRSCWSRFERQIAFVGRLIDQRGLVVAPPPLSMDWFPLGGPVFGASGKINLAFYEALKALASMSSSLGISDVYSAPALELRESILQHLWSNDIHALKMSDTAPSTGICQDIVAYARTMGISRPGLETTDVNPSNATGLPLAFHNLPGWDRTRIVSPYASGFEAESKFHGNDGLAGVDLIKRVWGKMIDTESPNYSGAHWEAMDENGQPFYHDTSLSHGWSSWPVFLLPSYLGGIAPIQPGWKRWSAKPVLAGLSHLTTHVNTVAGKVGISLKMAETEGRGEVSILVPQGTTCEVHPPLGWTLDHEAKSMHSEMVVIDGNNELVTFAISRLSNITGPES